MEELNKKEQKKSGLLAALSKLFKGGKPTPVSGSSIGSAGSAASRGIFGSSGGFGGLGGLFASKAGMVGMILGGATIAAGIGVVYNFIGPSSKPVYTPGLFQDTYYQDEAEKASRERKAFSDGSGTASSSLDYFKEQAKKDGLFGKEAESGENKTNSSEESAANAGAEAPVAAEPPAVEQNAARNLPKFQPSSGFGGSGGGGKSLAGMGGLSGGIGGQFQQLYRPPAGQRPQGESSAMKGKLAANIKQSPKTSLNFNKKGAYGQAKYANKMGAKAQYAAQDSGARTNAEQAFSGETTGAGDVASPGTGAGLGGSGLSSGDGLKSNDPNLNTNESSVPKPSETDEGDPPWKKWENIALYAMLASAVLIFITSLLVKKAKALAATAVTPIQWAAVAAMYGYAKIAAYMAMAAAALVVLAGVMMMSKFGQKWMGIMYTLVGGALIYKAYDALAGIDKGISDANAAKDKAIDAAIKANPAPKTWV